ncbi:MAG: BatA domain-containing protein [Planctomycetota bacterium]|nr:BatA domain-containing protein [Planctomycetota bacterium]
MLQFGSPIFLWGLPAVILPVLIHLRKRRRVRPVDFPPALLMEPSAAAARSLRTRIEDVLLMLLRCAILACVPLAMARPAWNPSAPAEGEAAGADGPSGEPADVVLVLDVSPSMSAFAGGPRKSLAEAIGRIAGEYPPGSRFAGVASDMRSSGWLGAARGVLDWHEKLPRRDLSGDLASALDAAASLLAGSVRERRDVFVLSDFQAASLPDPLRLAGAAGKLPPGARLHMVCAGAEPSNQWAVTGIELSRGVVIAGEPFRAAVESRCLAGGGRRSLEFRVNGKAVGTVEVIAAAGGAARAEFHALANEPGPALIEARLAGGDDWDGDDVRLLAFTARRPPAVALVVSGGGSFQERALEAAIAPFGRSAASRTELRLVPAGGLNDAALAGAECIVVAGDAGPDAAGWAAVRRVVERGAGLLLFAGVREGAEPVGAGTSVAPEENTKEAGDPGATRADLELTGIAWMAGLAPKVAGELSGPSPGLGLVFLAPRHPILAPFEGGRNGDLASVRFARARRFDLAASGPEWRDAATLAAFANGTPAIVEAALGSGRMIAAAFQPDPGEGSLSGEPAFVVFLHAAIAHLAGIRPVEPPRPCGAAIEVAVTPTPWPRRWMVVRTDICALRGEAGDTGGPARTGAGTGVAGDAAAERGGRGGADAGPAGRGTGSGTGGKGGDGGPGRMRIGPAAANPEIARIETLPGASVVRVPPLETAGVYSLAEESPLEKAGDVPAMFLTVEAPAAESDLAPSLGPWKALVASGLAAGLVERPEELAVYLASLRPGVPLSGAIFAVLMALMIVEGIWCVARPWADGRQAGGEPSGARKE